MNVVFVFYLIDSTVTASVVMVATAYLAYIVDIASNAKGVGVGFVLYYWQALSEWLELHDYTVSPAAVRGAKRSKLIKSSIPLTQQTFELLKLLIAKFPMFEYEALFAPSTHNELQVLMSEYSFIVIHNKPRPVRSECLGLLCYRLTGVIVIRTIVELKLSN